MRIEQRALPLAPSREYAFGATQLPFPVAPRLMRRAERRLMKRFVDTAPAELWQVRGLAEHSALLDQVRQTARCRARNATGRNSAAGLASYAATPEGARVERAMRKLEKGIG